MTVCHGTASQTGWTESPSHWWQGLQRWIESIATQEQAHPTFLLAPDLLSVFSYKKGYCWGILHLLSVALISLAAWSIRTCCQKVTAIISQGLFFGTHDKARYRSHEIMCQCRKVWSQRIISRVLLWPSESKPIHRPFSPTLDCRSSGRGQWTRSFHALKSPHSISSCIDRPFAYRSFL